MVRLASVAAFLLFAHSVIGAPVTELQVERSINVGSIVQYVCQHLPKALQSSPACSNALKAVVVNPLNGITTPFGTASGTASSDGSVVRFAVKYAKAARWQAPVLSTTWTMPYVSSLLLRDYRCCYSAQ